MCNNWFQIKVKNKVFYNLHFVKIQQEKTDGCFREIAQDCASYTVMGMRLKYDIWVLLLQEKIIIHDRQCHSEISILLFIKSINLRDNRKVKEIL